MKKNNLLSIITCGIIILMLLTGCPPTVNQKPTLEKVDGPTGAIDASSSTFEWSGSDPDGKIEKYEYRKDGGSWENNGLSTTYEWTGYPEGSHTFEVRAEDDDGDYSDIISWDFAYLVTHTVTVTLEDRDSYDFYTYEKGEITGGDLYYLIENGENKFWSNNIGQSPIIDLGEINFDAKINPPQDGYTRQGVEAFLNHVYVSEASSGNFKHVIFKVIGLTNDSVTIEYFATIK